MTVADRCRLRRMPTERRLELPLDTAFESGFYIPIDDVELGASRAARVVANGNLSVSWVDSTFTGSLDANDEPQDAGARVGLRGAVTVELGLEAGADVASTLRLAHVALPPFDFDAIHIAPFVQVRLHLAAGADTDGRVSVVAPFGVRTGFAFDGSVRAGLPCRPRFDPEVGLPDTAIDLTGSVEVEVVLALLLSVNDIPLGGPVLGTTFGALLAINPAAGWDVDGTVDVVGGWAFPDPLNPPFPAIPDELAILLDPPDFDIAGAPGPFTGGTVSTRWARQFDVDRSDSAVAVLPQGDGLVVIEAGPHPWLATLDGFGVPLRQTTAANPWGPAGMVAATNGDLLAAGVSVNSLRIDRFDPQGQPIWSRTLSAVDATSATCVALAATATNGAILAGHVNRSGAQTPTLIAIDEDGDVEWSLDIDMGSGSTNPAIEALASDPSGGFIAVGSVDFTDLDDVAEPPISGRNAMILRFASDGVLCAGYALGGGATIPTTEQGRHIAVHPDGSYTVGGHLGGAPNIWLAAMNADDSLRWSASYRIRPDTSASIDVANLTGVAPVDANGILMCGDVSEPDRDAWLMRVDAEGMPVWAKSYATAETDDELSGVLTLPDGLAAFGRRVVVAGLDSDLWILRTSHDGMLHFTADSALATSNTTPQWLRIRQHSVRTLTPGTNPLALAVDAADVPEVDAAEAFGVLLTDS